MIPTQQSPVSPYLLAYNGRLKGVLRWNELDAVWERLLRLSDDGWYVYAVGEAPPLTPAYPAVENPALPLAPRKSTAAPAMPPST